MEEVTREEAVNMINNIGGKIFTVVFYKRGNGELRTMNCRKGVTKHLRGGVLNYDPKVKNLIGVNDMKIKDREKSYRSISIEGIVELHIGGGKKYKVN